MERTSMALAVLALFGPVMACGAPNRASDARAAEPRLSGASDAMVAGRRICATVSMEGGVDSAYDGDVVNFLVPVRVRSVSVKSGCAFEVGGPPYSGGPGGTTYTLNMMVGGWSCSCE